ncbi:uncharacterized protein LOC127808828 [Diospyros lotus]|uniref:uncharacterized protein LOC127808828 n=1 Tax=Diospyros lotus TaxID=55363 RepID=UPI0022525F63|nr:uncharacterized protein LOC127808828 [Diospyros lotus]
MSKPKEGEELVVYLGVSKYAVSAALVREEDRVQCPVNYVSHRLLDAETRYSPMEKLAFSLVIASRKLRPYFQAHQISVMTKHLLKQILQKPNSSGRLLKWDIELAQFNIEYKPRMAIKGQVLADFLAEFTGPVEKPAPLTSSIWELFINGSSNEHGSGAGVLLISLEGHKMATNNEAEYEALLAVLRLEKEVKAERLKIFSDSQLVVCQVQGEYQTKGPKMVAYLQKVRELFHFFKECEVNQVPRSQNSHANALARLASVGEADSLGAIPIKFLATPSMEEKTETLTIELRPDSWMKPIVDYLQGGQLPNDKLEARCIRARAARYCICDDVLYKRGFLVPLLRCIDEPDCLVVLTEIHAGHYDNHVGGVSLAQKAFHQGFFWPTMK